MMSLKNALMVLSVSLGLAACDPDGEQAMTDRGSGIAQFSGAWQYESMEGQVTCAGVTETITSEVSGTVTFTPGAGPDQVLAVDEAGCRSVCQVSGNVAECQTDGSTCQVGEDLAITITQDRYTYANGKLIEESVARITGADQLDCTIASTARLARP